VPLSPRDISHTHENFTRFVPVRVLLVDDEVQQLAVRALVMKASGLSVITASCPIEALCILAGAIKKIEVAILDYDMRS
jgi:CheY-like chemotaxis protein